MFPHVANYPQSFMYFHHRVSCGRPKYSFIGLPFMPRDHASQDIHEKLQLVQTIDRSSTIAQINIWLSQISLPAQTNQSYRNFQEQLTRRNNLPKFLKLLKCFFLGGFNVRLVFEWASVAFNLHFFHVIQVKPAVF